MSTFESVPHWHYNWPTNRKENTFLLPELLPFRFKSKYSPLIETNSFFCFGNISLIYSKRKSKRKLRVREWNEIMHNWRETSMDTTIPWSDSDPVYFVEYESAASITNGNLIRQLIAYLIKIQKNCIILSGHTLLSNNYIINTTTTSWTAPSLKRLATAFFSFWFLFFFFSVEFDAASLQSSNPAISSIALDSLNYVGFLHLNTPGKWYTLFMCFPSNSHTINIENRRFRYLLIS